MSVFLTHSYENLFLLLLIPLHTSTLLGCLHELPLPLGPFPTHCLLSSQTTSSFSYSDLGCLCSYLLQCVLSPGIVHLLSLPVHPQPNPFLNPDLSPLWTTHTAVAQRRSKAVGESCPVSPLCSPVFPHPSVVSWIRQRQEQPLYSACLHCSLQKWSSILTSNSTNKITFSPSPLSGSISHFQEANAIHSGCMCVCIHAFINYAYTSIRLCILKKITCI